LRQIATRRGRIVKGDVVTVTNLLYESEKTVHGIRMLLDGIDDLCLLLAVDRVCVSGAAGILDS
jgi:hypothetical protein